MNKKIYLIDYGIGGNLGSIYAALNRVSASVEILSKPIELADGNALIVLPGVGNFSAVIRSLQKSGLFGWLRQTIEHSEVDVFGICIGMHILFEESLEADGVSGLSLLPGCVVLNQQIESNKKSALNVGWKRIQFYENSRFWMPNYQYSDFYFDHKYSPECESNLVAGRQSDQQFNVAAVVEYKNIIGAQFHPEISGRSGLDFFKSIIDAS